MTSTFELKLLRTLQNNSASRGWKTTEPLVCAGRRWLPRGCRRGGSSTPLSLAPRPARRRAPLAGSLGGAAAHGGRHHQQLGLPRCLAVSWLDQARTTGLWNGPDRGATYRPFDRLRGQVVYSRYHFG